MLRGLLHSIVKVADGSIGNYRYVGFEITPDEIRNKMKIACKNVADMLRYVLEDYGIKPKEEDLRLVASCIKDPHEVLEKYGLELDWYFPDPEEIAAEMVMRKSASHGSRRAFRCASR